MSTDCCSDNGFTVAPCNDNGDIFSYHSAGDGKWISPPRVNDVDTVAKENLMSLGGDGKPICTWPWG